MMRLIDSRTAINAGLAAVFAATIAVPFAGLWRAHDAGAEKRTLAAMPSLPDSVETAKAYPTKMQAFVNDNFGLRDRLLSLQADISRVVFGVSGSPRVIFGSGGWMFYTGDSSLADMQRLTAPTQADLANWKGSLTERSKWLEGQGIAYRFVTAPDKHSVFPEKLPTRYRWDGPTRFDAIKQYVGASARLVDLLPDLKADKAAGGTRLYFSTDTHWTGYGAYIGYRTIMSSLGEEYRDATVKLAVTDFSEDGSPKARDLAVMSRSPELETEKVAVKFAACGHAVDVSPPAGVDVSKILRFAAHECPEKKKTLLLFHDSFGSAISPYLYSTFGRVIAIWGIPSDELLVRMVQQEKPDLVIEERVERFMEAVPANTMVATLQKLSTLQAAR